MKRLVPLLLCAACAAEAPHIKPYEPRHRTYAPGAALASDEPSNGSLFRPGRIGANLFTDARAFRIDDLVIIRVDETADARRTAATDVTHASKSAASLSAFLKAANTTTTAMNGEAGLSGGSDTSMRGDGVTARTEHLTATVPALVKQVLPNGNLFVEGHRVVLVNAEEHHFYISGVVRPIDIDQQNSLKSSVVADAEIEFTGAGVLSDTQEQGWVSRNLGWLWPF